MENLDYHEKWQKAGGYNMGIKDLKQYPSEIKRKRRSLKRIKIMGAITLLSIAVIGAKSLNSESINESNRSHVETYNMNADQELNSDTFIASYFTSNDKATKEDLKQYINQNGFLLYLDSSGEIIEYEQFSKEVNSLGGTDREANINAWNNNFKNAKELAGEENYNTLKSIEAGFEKDEYHVFPTFDDNKNVTGIEVEELPEINK